MRILHFLPWYSRYYVGGTEQYLINLAKSQKSIGDTVEILQPNHELNEDTTYIEDIKVNLFSYPNSNNPDFIFGLSSQSDFSGFKKFLIEFKPDIIHFHGTEARFKYLHSIIIQLKINTIITPHFVGFSCPDGTLRQNGKTQCNGKIEMLKCSNCIIEKNNRVPKSLKPFLAIGINSFFYLMPPVLKNRLKFMDLPLRIHYRKKFLEYLGKQPNIKFDVLTQWYGTVLNKNGINPKAINITDNQFGIEKNYIKVDNLQKFDKIKFVFVGRITNTKGIQTIIEALKSLDEYKDDFEITFIGELIDAKINADLIRLISHGYKINIEGILPNDIVKQKMQSQDYLIFPSINNEMLPLTIQEAICNDLPIVASDLLGCKSLVLEGINGYFFKANDISDLTNLLTDLIIKRKSVAFKFEKCGDVQHDKAAYYEQLYTSFDLPKDLSQSTNEFNVQVDNNL